MFNSRKQPLVWLIVLIGLIAGISYLTVYLITTSYPLLSNGALVSCLVVGVLLLSLFARIQHGEYAYPRWCVFIIVIVLSVCCQLLLKYWEPLFIDIVGRKRYWSIMAEPSRIYFLVCWALLAILLLIGVCWSLLKLMRPFVVFGFYELSPLAIMVGFSAWVIGLESYQTPSLLQTLSVDLAGLLAITHEATMQWLYRGLIALFILIKITVAVLYREKWLEQVQRLLWISITVWLVMLLADMALIALKNVLASYMDIISIMVCYYLLVVLVTVVIFRLFLRDK